MKTVRMCFLAFLSTVSITVAASGVQAQSLPGTQGLNFQPDTSISQYGPAGTPGPLVARDVNSRSSAFEVNGDQPFDPIRSPSQPTAGDQRPPVVSAAAVTAPQRGLPGQPLASPQTPGQSPLPQIAPSAGGQPAPLVGPGGMVMAGQQSLPLPAAQAAANGMPLAYMPAAGALPYPTYGVAPAAYPVTQGGFGQPPAGYGQIPPYQLAPATGYADPGLGYPQGPPQPNGWATPAGYGQPQAFPAGELGSQSFCGACGGHGCANCGYGQGFGNGTGLMGSLLKRFLPYSEGGQCAPRWYDITMDAMYLKREETSRRVDFTADGPGPNPNIIMSTDDLNFEEQLGVRMNAAVQVLATATAEFTYFGLFSWNSSDSRSDPLGGLFSPISQFATFPPGGFPQTDNAVFHEIAYSSTLDNFELNFRRRWSAPNCRVQASFLMGVRYFYLLEDFRYSTEGRADIDPDPLVVQPGGTMDYNIRARNSLTGFQLGGDLWSSIVPGVKAGGELKAGVYGNYANQTTVIDATEPTNQFNENLDRNDIAVIADANLMVIWRVNPNWTIRAGYFLLYADGVLLAPEQFNSTAPPNLVSPSLRTQEANDNGSVFYHGGFAGLEWQW